MIWIVYYLVQGKQLPRFPFTSPRPIPNISMTKIGVVGLANLAT
jgi:hypothetical protein